MAHYATLLRDHVTLTWRSVDRIFLQAYVPKLQSVGGVCQSCTGRRGSGSPRGSVPVLFERRHTTFEIQHSIVTVD
jgi:hypothetical protein